MELDLNNLEFQSALKLIQETNESFFLTGKAGTGKSTFLKYIVENTPKNFVVVAPTGIAAVNVRGVTIHSFFQLPLRPILPEDDGIKIFWKDSEKRKIISRMDTLIIDEISMVRADIIDAIDYSLRNNGGNPNLPFGGKQILFVGDIFQLEPVTTRSSGEQKIISELYGSFYFYKAKVFNRFNLFTVELQKVYRQSDSEFISLLDKVRVKEISNSDIDKINSRVFSEKELIANNFAITLTTKNELANSVNSKKLSELNTKSFIYNAEVSGEFEESKYPTDPELKLKIGAQIIFIKNDIDKRWVNGTIGEINSLNDNEIKIKLKDNSIHVVEKRIWENIKYQYNIEKKKIEQEVIGAFKQYPIKLAWAITIHKSQGLTFDKVIVDFGNGTFASGQAYVALSRATTFEGILLKQKIKTSDIYIDSKIKDFAKTFNNQVIINQKINEGKDVYQLLKSGNLDNIGKKYLRNANEEIIKQNFDMAYSYLMKGFDYLICDCINGNWIIEGLEEILAQATSFNCSAYELSFIQAYVHWISKKYSKAKNYINIYIEYKNDFELGYYLKGRIYEGMDMYHDAMECYYKSLEIQKTNRALYRIGRTKEDGLNENGIAELYEVALNNVISHCSGILAQNSVKRGILLTDLNSYFVKAFNTGGDLIWYYCEKMIDYNEIKNEKIYLDDGTISNFKEEESKFLRCLIVNKELFIENKMT